MPTRKVSYAALEKNRDQWMEAHKAYTNSWFCESFGHAPAELFWSGFAMPFLIGICLIIFWCIIHLTMWIGS